MCSVSNNGVHFIGGRSAAKVDKNNKRYLETLGITDSKVSIFIDETDNAVNSLLKTAHKATDKAKSAEKFVKNIQHIKESIK